MFDDVEKKNNYRNKQGWPNAPYRLLHDERAQTDTIQRCPSRMWARKLVVISRHNNYIQWPLRAAPPVPPPSYRRPGIPTGFRTLGSGPPP